MINNSTATATGVVVRSPIPSQINFVQGTGCDTVTDPGFITCDIGTLAADESANIEFVVKGETTGAATLTMTASSVLIDPELSNNTIVINFDVDLLDSDGDGVDDDNDAFPFDPSETIDSDGDGQGDNADTDDDNDGVFDQFDDFPLNPTENTDTDNDGIGNNQDQDDDNDGVTDSEDAYPLDPDRSVTESGGGGSALGLLEVGLLSMVAGLFRLRVYGMKLPGTENHH